MIFAYWPLTEPNITDSISVARVNTLLSPGRWKQCTKDREKFRPEQHLSGIVALKLILPVILLSQLTQELVVVVVDISIFLPQLAQEVIVVVVDISIVWPHLARRNGLETLHRRLVRLTHPNIIQAVSKILFQRDKN